MSAWITETGAFCWLCCCHVQSIVLDWICHSPAISSIRADYIGWFFSILGDSSSQSIISYVWSFKNSRWPLLSSRLCPYAYSIQKIPLQFAWRSIQCELIRIALYVNTKCRKLYAEWHTSRNNYYLCLTEYCWLSKLRRRGKIWSVIISPKSISMNFMQICWQRVCVLTEWNTFG